jgi:hypothetical protein
MSKFVSVLIETLDTSHSDIESIVFSKDRAMQLHAFLCSYLENVCNPGVLHILHKVSTETHRKSYDDLKTVFSNNRFVFHEETDFRRELIDICEKSKSGKIMFYVDDMMFTHKLDYDAARRINTSKYILALTRGSDLTYSIVLQKPLSVPRYYSNIEGFESFKWNEADEISDWSFPLGVSGYMFGQSETVAMLKSINFKAPNSLEAGMQSFLPFFINRYGLCSVNAICTCVPANLVQSEWSNLSLGTFTTDELLSLWESGKMIDRQEFYGKPVGITQTQRYTFIDRR